MSSVIKNSCCFISDLKFQVLTDFNLEKNMIMFSDWLVLQSSPINGSLGLTRDKVFSASCMVYVSKKQTFYQISELVVSMLYIQAGRLYH